VHLARVLGVRSVVDVRVEERDDERVLREAGIELLHLPTLDQRAVSQRMLDDGVVWIGARLDRGDRVLVHCEHGVGRSALVGLCVLVSRGEAPLEALERAKAARPCVSPSPEQLAAFSGWVRRWCARTGAPSRAPSVDELGRIAWRHLLAAGDASG
jgi:protein-tyrosine phosphatase